MSEGSIQHDSAVPGPDGDDLTPTNTSAAVPRTGEPVVDQALQALQDLDSAPLDERPERLARVHEDLHRSLNAE